jgi:hypothetical protein
MVNSGMESKIINYYNSGFSAAKTGKKFNYSPGKIRTVLKRNNISLRKRTEIKHGCVPNKTFKLKFPTIIPDYLLNHFCRGYFDGDGSCFKVGNRNGWRLQVLGIHGFLYDYGRCVTNNCDSIHTNIYSHKNIHRLIYIRKKDVLKFGKWLYKDALIYLTRKYDKFQEALNSGTWLSQEEAWGVV